MTTQKILQYLVSERGRKFTLNTVCFSTIAMFGAAYVPNTIGISKFKEFLQAYK